MTSAKSGNGRGTASVLSSIALTASVIAIAAAGYAIYVAQFDSRLERMRQHDQIEFLEQRSEALQSTQSVLETNVTNLRLSAAETEALNQKRLAELGARISAQEDSIRQLDARSLDDMNSQIDLFEGQLAGLAQDISRFEAYFQAGVESWTLREVEQLLLIADYRLRFGGDAQQALTALQIAADRLAVLNDSAHSEVRILLAQNIQSVASIAQVDAFSLLEDLRILHERVIYLPVLGDLDTAAGASSPKTVSESANDRSDEQSDGPFRRLINVAARLLDGVSDLIQIEKNNRPIRPVISAEIRQLVFERPRLLLELAESALVRQQYGLVQERLGVAGSWVGENFDTSSDLTIEWQGMLDDVLTALPADALPDLSESIAALRAVMNT